MFIPIRRRSLSTLQIAVATIVGVAATIYVWEPIIKEKSSNSQKVQAPTNLEPTSGAQAVQPKLSDDKPKA